jgi:hypothetical protein
MAHYIAELMKAAEDATGDERTKKQAECAEAILLLWEHRHRLPSGVRPFEDLEAIFTALQRLDPQITTPQYFRTTRLAALEESEESEVSRWLSMADAFDYSARLLIRYFLACAAGDAIDKSKKWVTLAEEAASDSTFEVPIIRIITAESDLLQTDDPADFERKLLEERIEKLEAFKKLAIDVVAHFRRQLQPPEPASDLPVTTETIP